MSRSSSIPRVTELNPERITQERRFHSRIAHHAPAFAPLRRGKSRITCCLSFPAWCICAFAADVDLSKLPPPATNQIEFTRDIKPIFERSCFRCHGPERPKSRFNLADKDAALKGGENGVDIKPFNSAGSPLIHNVAGLVEDMQMPPEGKGERLTPAEIGLLRKWIDDGAVWETVPPEASYSLAISPTLGWTTVSGDEHKFREHYWQKEGWNGGAEGFLLTDKFGKDSKLTLEGRALLDDYRILLTLEKKEVGFTRFGWEQYRKYFDDTGGYVPTFDPSTFSLGRDLHLDAGRAWADFGLMLPDWPRIVLGYEYQYRTGEKATLQWGPVGTMPATAPNTDARNIYPASKAIDEHVHIVKFDLDHEIAGLRIEESFRGEFYDLQTYRVNAGAVTLGAPGPSLIAPSPSLIYDIREGNNYFQGANTFRLEKSFTDWWLASAGYLYSKLDADASFSMDALLPLVVPPPGVPFYDDQWQSHGITLERESHLFNATSLFGPWQGFTLSAGVLSEWTREQGVGSANKDRAVVGRPQPLPFFSTFDANVDKASVEESVALRYTTIPYTVLFGEARLQQQSIGQNQEEVGGRTPFLRDVDATSDLMDLRAGFNTSPWRWISLNAHYRHYEKESDYDQMIDSTAGYPAFILWRHVNTDEVQTKLAWRPRAWLKTSFNYQHETTRFQTATDPAGPLVGGVPSISPGGSLVSSHYDAHRYSVNAMLTRWRRLYLAGTFSYQDTHLAANDNNVASVVPYHGDVFSVLASATYVLNDKTDVRGSYSVSWADYGQDNFDAGLPVGIHYQQHALTAGLARHIGKNVSAKLQYGFYYYDEPSSGGANNYTAHAVFATLVMRLP